LKRVQRLMKKVDIQSITVKKFRPTPSKEKVVERDNLLQRDFRAKAKNEKWVGDITYIHTLQHGWCYLASVMDLLTKKIVALLIVCLVLFGTYMRYLLEFLFFNFS